MKLTKRAFSLILALVMLVAACSVVIGINVGAAQDAGTLDDTATAYDKLYVQDGLVMLLSAFDQAKAGITADANGNFATWNNKVKGGTDATFYNYVDSANAANSVLWKNRSDKGVGYDLTAAILAGIDLQVLALALSPFAARGGIPGHIFLGLLFVLLRIVFVQSIHLKL
jgi:hypothetical protein